MNVCQIIVGSLPYYTQLASGDMPNAVKGDSPLRNNRGTRTASRCCLFTKAKWCNTRSQIQIELLGAPDSIFVYGSNTVPIIGNLASYKENFSHNLTLIVCETLLPRGKSKGNRLTMSAKGYPTWTIRLVEILNIEILFLFHFSKKHIPHTSGNRYSYPFFEIFYYKCYLSIQDHSLV